MFCMHVHFSGLKTPVACYLGRFLQSGRSVEKSEDVLEISMIRRQVSHLKLQEKQKTKAYHTIVCEIKGDY